MQEQTLFCPEFQTSFHFMSLGNEHRNAMQILTEWSDAFSRSILWICSYLFVCGDLRCNSSPFAAPFVVSIANGNTMIALKLKWRRSENGRETILHLPLFFLVLFLISKIWWKVNTRSTESVYKNSKYLNIVTQPTKDVVMLRVRMISFAPFYNAHFKWEKTGFPKKEKSFQLKKNAHLFLEESQSERNGRKTETLLAWQAIIELLLVFNVRDYE